MTALNRTARLTVPHDKTLDWHAWWMPGTRVLRDRIGRGGSYGTRAWYVLRCNNTDCPGEALVSAASIVGLAAELLPGGAS